MHADGKEYRRAKVSLLNTAFNAYRGGRMAKFQSHDTRSRMLIDPQTGKSRGERDLIPGEAENLDNDQPDAGPDRDHKQLE